MSSSIVSVSSTATGGWLAGAALTVTFTVAVSVPPFPSEIEYSNESGPT